MRKWLTCVAGFLVLTALGAGYWHYSAPERTARRFHTLLQQRKFDEANALLVDGAKPLAPGKLVYITVGNQTFARASDDYGTTNIVLSSRSLADILTRRVAFSVTGPGIDKHFQLSRGGIEEVLPPAPFVHVSSCQACRDRKRTRVAR